MTKSNQFKSILMIAAVFLAANTAPAFDTSRFDHLKQPKISSKKDQKMLVVEAKGDPNIIGPKAFGLLFQLYYTIEETPKGLLQAAPRARWPQSLATPKSEWTGLYALPVPEGVTVLPEFEANNGLKARLEKWQYGKVAEILHVGPYTKETPTINQLKQHIKEQGYKISGPHEEEYILGPTMAGPGDPETYLTIIRYQVEKSK